MGNCISVSLPCDAILSLCLDSLLPRAAYVCKLEDNLQALKTSLEQLTSLKDDVKTRVEAAELERFMKRRKQVQQWIQSVETIETRVTQLVSDSAQEIEKLCCGGCCSKNYLSSYKYGKTVAKALAKVKELKNEGSFQEVAAECFDSAQERPSEATVGMDFMLDKAWKHVEDEEMGIIGLYGMGGVGKTTLLNQIHNKFLNSTPPNDFKLMIWVVVSKDHKLKTVQDNIGKQIGVSNDRWKDKEQEEKTQDIYGVLTKKKFVLLLDDIWEPVDVTALGVPIPNKRNKSKIIFTTRFEDVCSSMGAQKVKVECLKWEDAWVLFEAKVGKETLSAHPDIPKLAESVAKECDGLPLALKVVGRAMACKTKHEEWKYALGTLKKSAAEFSGTGNEVFTRLKYSYDNLPNEKLRSCFLYCALFPEDFLISKEDLLYFWMCEDILNDEYGNVDEAKNEAYHIIGTLVRACLLEDGGDNDVKMHDVVRDMALWVARDCGKENDRVLVYAADHGTPDVKRWKSTTNRVSFSTTNFERLVETPTSPNLLTLFITPALGADYSHRVCLTEIADGFFNYMPRLQVLDLSGNINLAALPSRVSNLLSLQYLNLSMTRIRELPVELKACVRLKYLNLNYTPLDFVPRNIISSFKMLKVLRMQECGSGDKILFDGEEALIEEIQGLKHLDELRLIVRSTSCIQKFLSYHTLAKCTRWLRMSDSENQSTIVLDISSLVDMEHLSVLEIHGYPKLEAMKISCAGRVPTNHPHKSMMKNQISLLGLQLARVYNCRNLKDLTWLIFAPKLSILHVQFCNEMEKIIDLEKLGGEEKEVREPSPFGKLRSLYLIRLPVLNSVYDSALPFPYLDEIEVGGCPELKKLPLNSTSAQRREVIIKGGESWWNGLEWEDQVSRDAFLPGFRKY